MFESIANHFTRTRKTVGSSDLVLFRPNVTVIPTGRHFRVEYPYDQTADPQRKIKEIARYELVARYLSGGRVLDVGSGSFYGAAILAESAQQVIGIESSFIAVAQAKAAWYKVPNLSCRQADNLRPVNGRFNAITLINVIEHMPEPSAYSLLREVAERLTGDGLVFLSTPRDRSQLRGGQFENPDHKKEYNEAALDQLVARSGLKVRFKYLQTMSRIFPGREADLPPFDRAWMLWLLRKAA